MALSHVTYTGNGSTTTFVVPFPYIVTGHIVVTIDDVVTTGYTWSDSSTLEFAVAPTNGVSVKITRDSDINQKPITYSDGSSLTEEDLNEDSDYNLYIDQETRDVVNGIAEGGNSAQIIQNTTDIATNTSNITSNDTDIATNASGVSTNASNLTSHLNDTTDAHDASAISNVASGNITSTNQQDVNNELQSDIDSRATSASVSSHIGDTTNPHSVTKSQVGLSSVDNTSDVSKPVSTAQQTALDLKADKSDTYTKAEVDSAVGSSTLDGLTDTNLTGATDGEALTYDTATSKWIPTTISGSGAVDSVNTQTGAVVLDADDISDTVTTNKYTTAGDISKLAGIEAGATADQTGAEIKTAYESRPDTNAFTDLYVSKVDGIESNATRDQTGAQIKTAYELEADTNAFTDAQVTKLTGIEAGATVDTKELKVSANDTTPAFLEDKVVASSGIIKTILNEGVNEQVQIKLGPHYLSQASTGLYTGGTLSVGATTGSVDIAVGEGFYIDNSVFPPVNLQGVVISARTNFAITNIATQPVTYISIDKNDAVIQQSTFPTPTNRRDNIFLGVAVHTDNVNIQFVNNLPSIAYDITGQVHDIAHALGFFNLGGNIVSPNGANLSFDKSSGTAFKDGANVNNNPKDPHTLTLPVKTLSSFRYRNQDSSEGSDITLIDPTTYDLNGTTTTVPTANNATIQRIYIFPSNEVRVMRGQEVFANFSSAVNAVGKENHIVEPNIDENGLLIASIVMKKGTTDISDTSSALIFIASRFGELGSVGSSATGDCQQTYLNSTDPEFTTVNGAVTFKAGQLDTNNVIESKNLADAVTFSVTGAGVITGSNLSGTNTGDQSGAQIKTAYELEANAFTDTQFTKLAGIETSATADQTGAEIKIAYQAEANAFTDAQFTKLAGIATGASATISGLTDTNIATLVDGHVMAWDNATSKWVNGAPTTGSTTLDALTDTTITTPAEGNVLTYDNATSKWINSVPAAGGYIAINATGDFTEASYTNVQFKIETSVTMPTGKTFSNCYFYLDTGITLTLPSTQDIIDNYDYIEFISNMAAIVSLEDTTASGTDTLQNLTFKNVQLRLDKGTATNITRFQYCNFFNVLLNFVAGASSTSSDEWTFLSCIGRFTNVLVYKKVEILIDDTSDIIMTKVTMIGAASTRAINPFQVVDDSRLVIGNLYASQDWDAYTLFKINNLEGYLYIGNTEMTASTLIKVDTNIIDYTITINDGSAYDCSALGYFEIQRTTGEKSGSYTPTYTNTANVASTVHGKTYYTRTGDIVTVSGRVDITATAGSTETKLRISLPISSNLVVINDVVGTGQFEKSVANTFQGCVVEADVTNNQAVLRFSADGTASETFDYKFSYEIL